MAKLTSELVSLLQNSLRHVPRAAWICAIVAILNAVCWSVVTPPFQAPDEPDHYAYVKQLAETGSLPTSSDGFYEVNVEAVRVLNALRYPIVRQQPRNRTISSAIEQEELEHTLRAVHSEQGPSGSYAAGTAASQPPLYYALEAVPFSFAGNMLAKLQLMRLLSALMAGISALFIFLFVREALPGVRWAWTVGGAAVAVAPLLGFISGVVNPDSMLTAVSAALFYVLARAFRRGLTLSSAVLIGVTILMGSLTKLNFLGLVPGALTALVVLALRARQTIGRSAWRSAAIAFAIALAPIALYALVNLSSNHAPFGLVSGAFNSERVSLHSLEYIWQLFLPPLPGMGNDFPGLFTARQLWFNGYVGLYGWLDTTFPSWVYNAALVPFLMIVGLFALGVLKRFETLRSRIGELLSYASMALGLLGMIGYASYAGFPDITAAFAEPRYLLPLAPLFAAVLALAARGAGRRWGPVVGVLIVVLFLAHDIFSQLLVAARFYA